MEGPDDKRGKYPLEGRQGRPDPAQEGPVAIGPPKNALGNTHSQCPPIDFRSLPNADVATSILKEIAESFSSEANSNETPIVSFVDTGFLIDPVWDSAADGDQVPSIGNPERGLAATTYHQQITTSF
jgi:hypothetical protein